MHVQTRARLHLLQQPVIVIDTISKFKNVSAFFHMLWGRRIVFGKLSRVSLTMLELFLDTK